ncbi:MAG: AmmeMemoRadiSam system protein B [Candidatus Aminicenantales bacterium]
MNKHLGIGALFLTLLAATLGAQGIRPAKWAGQFYDSDAKSLSSQLKDFLSAAPQKDLADLAGLIVPHAGYIYSGRTAALGYRQVQGRDFETVVILGPSHYVAFQGCSIYPRGGFQTPLGTALVDEDLAAALMKESGFGYMADAHSQEHSVEVQVPFIQTVLPNARIVPVVMGFPNRTTVETLAQALFKVRSRKKFLVVASTDLSHFLTKKEANTVDAETAGLIQNFKMDTLLRLYLRNENVFCGGGPVLTVLLYAQKLGKAGAKVLGQADSSAAGGPEDKVVGYLAAAITSAPETKPLLPDLNKEDRAELLKIARLAVERAVKDHSTPAYKTQSPRLKVPGAAFVTLTERGRLRGCIGYIEPVAPLFQTVIQAAALACQEDLRFDPVSEEELKMLDIEISILSPLTKITDPGKVRVGTHGLVISRGPKLGLLLPQVATENNWGREEFLKQACLKAGLPPDDWKKGADISIFEAIIIH